MVKGFNFIDKKLTHFETNLPKVIIDKTIEKMSAVFESKMKSYVNNMMVTTIESTVRKQLTSMGGKMPPIPVPIQPGLSIKYVIAYDA